MNQQSKEIYKEIALNGRLITSEDATQLQSAEGGAVATHFQQLLNMRYGRNNPKSIKGMAKINATTALAKPKVRSAFHYYKQEDAESHVIAQAYNSGETAFDIVENITAIPSTGDFVTTALYSDADVSASGAGKARFSPAPNNQMAYCDGTTARIMAGNETEIAQFLNVDPAATPTFSYDYTSIMQNDLYDTNNIAPLHPITTLTTILVGTTRPIGGDSKGLKIYIHTANAVAGTMLGYYWNGTTYTALSNLVDGTASGGASLAQTGWISFDSTVTTAKAKVENEQYLYWYKFTVTNLTDGATKLKKATCHMPFQSIVDLWDGDLRNLMYCFSYNVGANIYTDYSTNIYKDNETIYDPNNPATYVSLSSYSAGHYLYVGYPERMSGLYIQIDDKNAAASVLTVSYSHNGSAWTSLTTTDGTSDGGVSLSKSGFVTWNALSSNSEFPMSHNGSARFYFYKLAWSNNLSAGNLKLFSIKGITAQSNLLNYNFPFFADNSLWIVRRNIALKSNEHMADVFNGEDSTEIAFGSGDDLVAQITLYSQKAGNIYSIKIFFTTAAMYGLSGNTVEEYDPYLISGNIGCVAPDTLKQVVVRAQVGEVDVIVWEGMDGFYMFDNTVPKRIDDDISHFFEKDETTVRSLSVLYRDKSFCVVDKKHNELHWHFADGASTGTCNREFVFNLRNMKWTEFDRGTKDLQFAIEVQSTDDNSYEYGFIDTGYMERLEYGSTMDGEAYSGTVHLGDIAPAEGSMVMLSQLIDHRIILKGQASSTQSVAITHYGDTSSTGTALTSVPCVPATGKRVVNYKEPQGCNLGNYTFHSVKYVCPIDSNTVFEPIFIAHKYNIIGENKE